MSAVLPDVWADYPFTNGVPYPLAVADGEHGDHESAREVDLVVERS